MNKHAEITPARMVILGLGWFGFQFFWGLHTVSIPLFLRSFTESKLKISVILCMAGVAGSVVPPVVGYFSDRSSSRFGRRAPYIFFGGLGVLLCVVGLPHLGAFNTVAVMATLMYFSLRIAETPYLSLLPDITPPQQRSTVSGVMNLLGSIGLVSYFIIGSIIWEKNTAATFYMTGIVYFGLVLITINLIKEPEAPPEERSPVAGPWEYIKGIAKETNVLKFFIAQFFWWAGFWMVSAFAALFVVEELGREEDKAFLVLMAFAIVAILFMLPLGMLGDRLGRKGILSFMVAFWVISEIYLGLSQDLTQAIIRVGFTAIPFAAIMGVGLAYLLDLIPTKRTAEFVGFSIISIALAQTFGPLLSGQLIDTLGYRSIFPTAAAFMAVGFVILQFVRPRQDTPDSKQRTGEYPENASSSE